MEEAQRPADRVAVITAGHIVAEGSPSTLAGRELGTAVVTFPARGVSLDEPLPAGVAVQRADGHVAFRTSTPTRT